MLNAQCKVKTTSTAQTCPKLDNPTQKPKIHNTMPNLPAHLRIDEGIKRPKKARVKPSDLEREARQRARNGNGTYLPIHSPEQRQAVIADALAMLQQGFTTNDIGAKHGVTGQAVRIWLVAAQAEADDARTLFYSQQQVQYLDEMDSATAPLALARARECFSGWHKVAQVRDPRSFGPKQEVTHTGAVPVFVVNAPIGRVIDAEPVAEPQQSAIAAPLIEVSK